MTSHSFTTLIVTYNSANDILNLLADLRAYAPASNTILIDNASSDRTVPLVCEQYPEVQCIRNSANVGYARAVNQGVALCDTEYVLLLNPDIRITTPDLFSSMENRMRRSRQIAAVAPLQFKDDGTHRKLNFTWSYLAPKPLRIYLSFLVRRRSTGESSIPVTFLNAGCLFVRRAAFNQVGKLNEKYFLYGEEPDLFLKFKRFAYLCYLLPNVHVIHYRERSFRTVPVPKRVQFKLQAIRNITDALLRGWAQILFDKLILAKAPQVKGNDMP